MPERKYKVRNKVESDEVQGEGSWVILRSPTFDDLEGFDPGELSKIENDSEAAQSFGFEIAGKMIEDWNWVGDDDKPMPKPQEVDNPMSLLSLPEMMFVIRKLNLDKLVDADKLGN